MPVVPRSRVYNVGNSQIYIVSKPGMFQNVFDIVFCDASVIIGSWGLSFGSRVVQVDFMRWPIELGSRRSKRWGGGIWSRNELVMNFMASTCPGCSLHASSELAGVEHARSLGSLGLNGAGDDPADEYFRLTVRTSERLMQQYPLTAFTFKFCHDTVSV
ncbi:hypothetical protein F511_33474 [Dorcoceras hygrometricum]|uniref:Uncharacterized protein n=1 Tax=Dorcoceras hygrometricum TaxID=472368 RepID=A0A2Z7DHW2_9LAMI|nr:hypothetical protein F511_33474 [Dorcoceras hygrometricum]